MYFRDFKFSKLKLDINFFTFSCSLRMYRENRHILTKQQRLELSRRTVSLLLYLMRSPVFEKFTQRKLNALLNAVACTIPFSNAICQPLIEYIPFWQRAYFYMWST